MGRPTVLGRRDGTGANFRFPSDSAGRPQVVDPAPASFLRARRGTRPPLRQAPRLQPLNGTLGSWDEVWTDGGWADVLPLVGASLRKRKGREEGKSISTMSEDLEAGGPLVSVRRLSVQKAHQDCGSLPRFVGLTDLVPPS